MINKNLRLTRLLVLICGVLSTVLAFMIATIGGNLVQISTSLNGAFNGPNHRIIYFGMFF